MEAGRVNEKLSNDEFNSVISLENENVVIASTLNGHLNIYRLLNNYQLVESISLEILHDNYMRNKESNLVFAIIPLYSMISTFYL